MRNCDWCGGPVETARGRAVCPACKIAPKSWAEKTPAERRAQMDRNNAWQRRNRDKMTAAHTKWYYDHLEAARASAREYQRRRRAKLKASASAS